MNIDNKSLQLKELDMLDSQQLGDLLHTELEKDKKDTEKVLQILRILETREAGDPNNNVDVGAAWNAYKENLQKDIVSQKEVVRKDRKSVWRIGKIATVAAIVCLLVVAAPKVLGTENIFEIFGRWTKSVFEFFNPADSTEPPGEYVFKTDHSGLQQIYDAIVEHGVTQPVVPSWVPDGFELDEIKTMPVRNGKKVYAGLVNSQNYITIAVEIYNANRTNQYTKDDADVGKYELAGITHYVMKNEENIQAVWVVDNLECMILANCEEEVMYNILKSIYRRSVE